MKRRHLLFITLCAISGPSATAQMPPSLFLDMQPSVPPALWAKYESQMKRTILCDTPLTLIPSQLRELATDIDQGGDISIVPPRSFKILGFQVQRIQVQIVGDGSYSYRFTDIAATAPIWKELVTHRVPTKVRATHTSAASVLRLHCNGF